jgi:hypothetical protein
MAALRVSVVRHEARSHGGAGPPEPSVERTNDRVFSSDG